jgi:GNAT superfamily N-acetyltransferase
MGVEFLHPSRRRRRIRRRYGFALPRRVDACGGLAGSERRPGEEVLDAELDGQIVGCANVEDRGNELELVNIDVPLQLHGRGVGTILVRSVEQRARAEGKRAVTAGTSRNAEEAAHAARGESFDLKSWHMAPLSLGSLGLDDLADELAQL